MKITRKQLGQFFRYMTELQKDIYIQPPDDGHSAWAKDAIDQFSGYWGDVKSVLDVGCGSGFCEPLFKKYGMDWAGQDYFRDKSDISFLPFPAKHFDVVFARHVLEHSPMPLITLMEWRRISKRYAFIILPAPEYWLTHGRNHYYVLPKENWWNLFDVAGWRIVEEKDFSTSDKLFMKYFMPEAKEKDRVWNGPPKIVEFRYLLEKKYEKENS